MFPIDSLNATAKVVLLVEDEAVIALKTARFLQDQGYLVKTSLNAEDAVSQVRQLSQIDLVLMDVDLGKGMDGTEAARIILQERDVPIIFLSSHSAPQIVARIERIPCYGYLLKSSHDTMLLASIKLALQLHESTRQVKEREARYRLLLHSGNDAIFVHGFRADNLPDRFVEVNQKSCEMLGYQASELLQLSPLEISVPPAGEEQAELAEHIRRNSSSLFEMRLRCKDGSLIDTELSSHLVEIDRRPHMLTIARDITKRKRAEKALRESEEQFRLVWEESPIAKELYDARGELVDVNRACLQLFGVSSLHDVRGFRLFEDPNLSEEVKLRLREGQTVHYEAPFDFDKIRQNSLYHTQKRGVIQLSIILSTLQANGETAGYLAQVQDVTLRHEAEAALEHAVSEKSMLLRDLQHRIKNSLTLITSLIVLGEQNAAGDEAKTALEELYSRVKALAGLYDVLYGSNQTNQIYLDQYLRQVGESLGASFMNQTHRIDLHIECEPLLVDARYATPFGLILNELMTNAIKYAFPDGQPGLICVHLRLAGDMVELVVSNDGCTIPGDFDMQKSSGLGLQIVQMLVGQLHGQITYQSNGHTTFIVQVPLQNILN